MIQHYSKQFVIQLNIPSSQEKKYVNLNNLVLAFQNDADLASLPQQLLPYIMTSLFIVTGSDFTSYFKTLGKATFLNNFFQFSKFISGSAMPGCLSEVNQEKASSSYLAFLRLIGTAYFKKHLASFISI